MGFEGQKRVSSYFSEKLVKGAAGTSATLKGRLGISSWQRGRVHSSLRAVANLRRVWTLLPEEHKLLEQVDEHFRQLFLGVLR